MPDSDPTKSDVSEIDRLQAIAAQVMIRLEDAHETAMRVQEPGLGIADIESGFNEIRSPLQAAEKLLAEANRSTAGTS